jgi:hypothetical protein
MKDKQMWLYMMLTDMAITAVLQLFADMGVGKDEVTREMWLEINQANVERRKGIMAKINSH